MSRFRLAGLLRVRTIQEEQVRGELGAAQLRLTAARAQVRSNRSALVSAGPPAGGSGAVFLAQVAARAAMASAVDQAISLRAIADDDLEAARATWMQARMRARAVERLEERHTEAEQVAFGRSEQAASDDLAGARHSRDDRTGRS